MYGVSYNNGSTVAADGDFGSGARDKKRKG
jgi:hypothetical protein